jgi:hypothetical protein
MKRTDYAGDMVIHKRGAGLPIFLLGIVCFVPSGAFYLFGQSGGPVTSLAPGVVIICLVLLGLIAAGKTDTMSATRLANYASFGALVSGAIIVHLVGSIALRSGTEPARALLSLPLLMLMLAGGSALATLLREHAAGLPKAISLIRWILIGLTLVSLAGIQPPSTWEKPIFPFSEPSHLALVISPFLMHACITNRGIRRGLWIVGCLALAYAAQSLTMMAAVVLASLICLPLAGIVAAAAVALFSSAFVDLGYFTDRLDFDPNTQNLSTLVYRQGWELVSDAMERTSGWGVGFQQLGYAPFRSPSADAIYAMLRNDGNTRDGGFLLAKVVSEFGVAGWLMVGSYLTVAAYAAWQARRFAEGRITGIPPHVVFAYCAICTFSVDMFVRDVGYFASSVLLFITSIYIIWEARQARA